MRNRKGLSIAALTVGSGLSLLASGTVDAQSEPATLTESQVLLLYNSQNQESLDIRNIYLALHPGVLEYDMNLVYPDDPGDPDPPVGGITNHYITPSKFIELFRDPNTSAFRRFIDAKPRLLAIVTTRGLPAVASDNFDPDPNTNFGGHFPPSDGIWASFEAALSHPGIDPAFPEGTPLLMNPYFRETRSFRQFLKDSCPGGVGQMPDLCPGDMYLVTRLDSSPPQDIPANDFDQDGDVDAIDGVYRMLNNSMNVTVNKFAVSALFDRSPNGPGGSGAMDPEFRGAIVPLWDDQWCALHDNTIQFIHGPTDTQYDEATDGPFNEYPFILLVTEGRNHNDPNDPNIERPLVTYPRHYDAHPGALFDSIESFNGWKLHDPDRFAGQGQSIEWIGWSGGSLAFGNIQEPTISGDAFIDPLVNNLLINGLTWAESAYSALVHLGHFQTPVGDPLVRIIAFNPDLTGDRIIDQADRDIVLANLGGPGPEGDINGDGWVDQADLDLVDEAFGRDCSEPPLDPIGNVGCGDIDSNCIVDETDLDLLLAAWGPCALEIGPCQEDLTGDAVVDIVDLLKLLANLGRLLGDCDGDCDVDIDDLNCIFASWGTECGDTGFNPNADVNCDCLVGVADQLAWAACFGEICP